MDDVILLSRLQFAVAVFFHFIFVPLTLGLSLLIALMETRYVRTGDEVWRKHAKFWGKLFIINFTLGVVTGITLEFQFGTNWARYSEYVGDIFGSLLAIEATVAFFLESTFLAVWHFGWHRVGKKTHLLAIWLVVLAGNLSALWIILANGFMQNPLGYVIQNGRAELADFMAVVTNPYAWGMYAHTLLSAWTLSCFFVLGVSSWHLLRKSNVEFFRRSFRMTAPICLVLVLALALSGDIQGKVVSELQPAKLAAMESHWETTKNAPFYLAVVPDEANETNSVESIGIPGLLSWISYGDADAEVKGLKDFPKEDRPPVTPVFWGFRAMIFFGVIFLALAAFAIFSLLLPLRPTTSVAERRDLAKFPEFSVQSLADGSYTSGIDSWFADTFPLRDAFFQLNSWVKSLYGIRTVEVVGEVQTGDEIPDAPYLGE